MSLQFSCEISWDVWREALSEVVSLRTNAPNKWVVKSHKRLPREIADELFEEVCESDAATLSIAVRDGGGDPRYGELLNTINLKLHIKPTNEVVSFASTSSSRYLHNDTIYVTAPTVELQEQIRQALRARLGAEHDRSLSANHALAAIREAQRQGSSLAKLWVDEALTFGPQSFNWGELLRLEEEINGKSEALLRRRLREAPYDESAWRAARKTPPAEISKPLIEAMLRRFETKLPEGAQWTRCEDGVGPGGRRIPLGRRLFHKLFGFRYASEDPTQYTYTAGASTWFMKQTAGALPVTFHEFTKEQDLDRIGIAYIWGEGEGDFICLLTATQRSNNLDLGEALCIQGSDDFQRRVLAKIDEIAPFRWIVTEEQALFEERTPRDLHVTKPGASPEEKISHMIALAGLPYGLAAVHRVCQCRVVSCEHHQMINTTRRALEAHKEINAEWYQAQAKLSVLQLVQMFIYQKKIDAVALQQAEENLARCQAICADQPLF